MTPSARRSLTDPSGLKASILTNRLTPVGASLLIRTTGVRPTVSRIFANLAMVDSPKREFTFTYSAHVHTHPALLLSSFRTTLGAGISYASILLRSSQDSSR